MYGQNYFSLELLFKIKVKMLMLKFFFVFFNVESRGYQISKPNRNIAQTSSHEYKGS